jgi:hypothetical protein
MNIRSLEVRLISLWIRFGLVSNRRRRFHSLLFPHKQSSMINEDDRSQTFIWPMPSDDDRKGICNIHQIILDRKWSFISTWTWSGRLAGLKSNTASVISDFTCSRSRYSSSDCK